jgi:predicted Fe-Mo cluster-binding NifX family protein
MDTMKIAITSQNFRTVTGHAGKTRRFLIYAADQDTLPLEIGRFDLPQELSMHEFQGGPHPLDAVDMLITASAGDGFVRKLAERGIRVIITGEEDPLVAIADFFNGSIKAPAPHEHACQHH